jgi:nucleotide-binding universal stress UspA family protein
MQEFPKKILLATDGSEDSTRALQMAADLSTRIDVELHVVYVTVVSPWIPPGTLSDTEYETLRREQEGWFDEQVRQVEAAGGKVAGAHFRTGRRADEEIIKLSEELGVGMIMVGSRGRNSLERSLVGSDSESIVRYSRCPVLVVRADS